MLCKFILYLNGETYSLKSTPNDRILEKLFIAILFTLRVFVRNMQRGNCRINTFCILFWCLAWDSNPGFTSNKPAHYLLEYGWCIIMLQNPWLVFPQFYALLTNCFTQSVQNFKVVFLVDRTTFWQEFTIHHVIAIEEKSEQNLHIWPNLKCFFQSWLFWTLKFGWLDFEIAEEIHTYIHNWPLQPFRQD